jgi:FHA domain-containing protein/transglycosylase-like protein with SLT domain
MQVTFILRSPAGTREVPMTKDRLTFGSRGDAAEVVIEDSGLSRLHASINRQGSRLWILDEGSSNGTYVNSKPVSPKGTLLGDADEISIGDRTTLIVAISPDMPDPVTAHPASGIPRVGFALTVALLIAALAGAVIVGLRFTKRTDSSAADSNETPRRKLDPPPATVAEDQVEEPSEKPVTKSVTPVESNYTIRLYRDMKEQEKLEFIESRARHISMAMSSREYDFPPETLGYIKEYVDGYARRVGNNSTRLWGEDLRSVLNRASKSAPFIVRSFNERGVPPVVGLYIAMIETEYHACLTSNVGAQGVLQLMPATARMYGLDPKDRCDLRKLTPAAAKYVKDRIAEFGTDSMSVALGIAAYNRSPDSIRRDLHDVLDPANKERTFWTLVANKGELDHWFQNENVRYVPKFFAAAVVGETPLAFGVQMKPLSTYGDVTDQ